MDVQAPYMGLTLSGGGHRAGVFHLGVLARLADGDLLNKVKIVSTVSGGSLAMAFVYAANNNQWCTAKDYNQQVLPRLRAFYTKRDLEWDFIIKLLWPPSRTLQRRANYLAEAIHADWEVHGKLSDVSAMPKWIINATTIESGKNWRFGTQLMGDYILGFTPSGDFPIADAVAASAGFPIGIGPLTLATAGKQFVKPFSKAQKIFSTNTKSDEARASSHLPFGLSQLNLWDGGVYDNLGIQPLIRHFKPRLDNAEEVASFEELRNNSQMYRELRRTDDEDKGEQLDRLNHDPDRVEFMIVSDASPEIKPTPFARLMSFKRLVTLPTDHTRMMYSAQIVTMMRAAKNSGAYLQFDNSVAFVLRKAKEDKMLEGVPQSTLDRIIAASLMDTQIKALATYGTRLRQMTSAEFDGIFRHGYEQADATLYGYNRANGAGFDHIPFTRFQSSGP